jgi:hypothetical protein
MASFLSRWRWRHLAATWVVYWAGLALATLWRPIGIARRLSTLPEGQASMSAELGNGMFSAHMLERDVTVWSGSASVLAIVLWIAGPPLLVWLVWAMSRVRPGSAESGGESSGEQPMPAATREAALRDGIGFADHVSTDPPRREPIGVPRDRGAR